MCRHGVNGSILVRNTSGLGSIPGGGFWLCGVMVASWSMKPAVSVRFRAGSLLWERQMDSLLTFKAIAAGIVHELSHRHKNITFTTKPTTKFSNLPSKKLHQATRSKEYPSKSTPPNTICISFNRPKGRGLVPHLKAPRKYDSPEIYHIEIGKKNIQLLEKLAEREHAPHVGPHISESFETYLLIDEFEYADPKSLDRLYEACSAIIDS